MNQLNFSKLKLPLLSIFALCIVSQAQGQFISNINAVNNSTANSIDDRTGQTREFNTQINTGSVSQSGMVYSFTNQFAFSNAHIVEPGGPTVALTHSKSISYDLLFTVNDPMNFGYTLSVDSALRGFISIDSSGPGTVTGSTGAFSGRIDTDLTDGMDTLGTQLNDLTILGVSRNTAGNHLVDPTRNYDGGNFVGTNDFALRFTSFGSPTNVFLQNNQTGEGALRFGLEPGYEGGEGPFFFRLGYLPRLRHGASEYPRPLRYRECDFQRHPRAQHLRAHRARPRSRRLDSTPPK